MKVLFTPDGRACRPGSFRPAAAAYGPCAPSPGGGGRGEGAKPPQGKKSRPAWTPKTGGALLPAGRKSFRTLQAKNSTFVRFCQAFFADLTKGPPRRPFLPQQRRRRGRSRVGPLGPLAKPLTAPGAGVMRPPFGGPKGPAPGIWRGGGRRRRASAARRGPPPKHPGRTTAPGPGRPEPPNQDDDSMGP